MTRAISVLLGLGLLATTGVAADFPREFQEHAAVQESLGRVHPRARASWLRARGLDDSYYTTFRRPESSGLSCIGRWPWGPSWELAGRDTFLYLGSGSGVRILSIADSVQPRMLGQINARGLVSQVVVQDSLLFVACGSWGAQIYSVSDPANPRELGSMDAVIGDLCAGDTFCYTIGGGFLRVYSVADPAMPTEVGVSSDSGDAIVVANGHAFIGGPGPLDVYDVGDPRNPVWVNSVGGPTYDMFLRRSLLFCTMGASPTRFSILNVSDPLNIIEVSRLSGYAGDGVYANDSFALVSCIRDHVGLFLVDVSDSTRPSVRDSINSEGVVKWQPYAPCPNSYGYLASDYGGLITLDLHNANSISQAWAGYQAQYAVDISLDGNLAYVADLSAGLQILSVSDPAEPASVGRFDTLGSKATRTAVARDSLAFIGMDGIARRQFFRVLNVLDPSNPTLVAQESCFNCPEDFVIRDTFIYAVEANRFQVFNIARPREPVLVGSCASTDGVYFGLAVRETMAYVAGGPSLEVISIADPTNPHVIDSGGRASMGAAVRDTFAYVPYVYDTLFVYSVADPANFRELSAVPIGLPLSDVALAESEVFVSTANGISVYDLDDPAQPTYKGSVTSPNPVLRLTYSGGLLYAAMQGAGIAIYETTSVGIHEQPVAMRKPGEFRVWPSVTRGSVRLALGAEQTSDVAVFDMSGKQLRDATLRTKGGDSEGSIDLSGLAAGVYIMRVRTAGKYLTAKVVKTNRR
jgi:hypothetical protein